MVAKTHTKLNLLQRNRCMFLQCSTPVLRVSVALKCKMSRYPRFATPSLARVWESRTHWSISQGFDDPVNIFGSTPDLDDFTIRIEDGPGNIYVDEASRIGDAVGRTNFAGYRVEQGNIWQAKSEFKFNYFVYSVLILIPQSTSWIRSSLGRVRSWNLSAPRNIRPIFLAPPLLCRSRTVSNPGATFSQSRKRSVEPSNSIYSMRVRAQTTN